MQFYNATDKELSLYHDALYWAKASTAQYPLDPDFTRNANFALDNISALIMRSDAVWEWEDANNTDLPIATTDLVSGQSDYSIPVTHLKILRVRIKDSNGNLRTLDPISRRQVTDSQLAGSGTPTQYDKLGNSIFLIVEPDYDSAGGLEVQFQRGASYFTPSDTTKTPGFATQFHRLISYYAALDYTDRNSTEKQSRRIQERITKMEADLVEFYSTRDHDAAPYMALRKEDYGGSALGMDGAATPRGFDF